MKISETIEDIDDKEILTRQLDIKNMNNDINLGDEISKDLPSIRQTYATQAMDNLRKSLYVKIQTLIRDEKIKQLNMQKQVMEDSKLTAIERIFGKGKLKNEQLRFIDLQIKSLRDQPIEQKEKYSVKDSLAQMKAFAILNYTTEEMEELENNIYQIFGGFRREEVEELAKIKNKQKSELPIPVQENAGLFQIRKNAKLLQQQNNIIEEEIQENIVNANSIGNIQNTDVRLDAVISFKNKLQAICNAIKCISQS